VIHKTPTPVATAERAALRSGFDAVRAATERLCQPLVTEDYTLQSMPDASPTRWHLAHTTWFFETFLLKAVAPHRRPAHPAYEHLFNSYYNAVGAPYPRPRRGLLSRPTVAEVFTYRRQIDAEVRAWLERAAEPEIAAWEPVVTLGLQHEQQHQELILTDLKHAFSFNPLRPAYRTDPLPGGASARSGAAAAGVSGGVRPGRSGAPETPDLRWLEFAGGVVEIGHAGAGFAFDNEGPRHRVFLEPFALAAQPLTNADVLAFIADGGYHDPRLWLSDGWNAARAEAWEAPLYWEEDGGAWRQFTLAGMRPVDPAEPACHLSYYEADAVARWAGARLPTEAEWEHAAKAEPVAGNFVETGRFHPAPLRGAAGGAQAIFGDVWEWTGSAYAAYPGFQTSAGALGEYNGKFMSGQMVLRGGSCASPRDHLRATYRNFFPPQARWQFTGARLARSL